MYKVFNNEFLIILNSEPVKTINTNNHFRVNDKQGLRLFLNNYFSKTQDNDILIFGYDTEDLFNDFRSFFKYIEAAGGVVENQSEEYLFIKRLGYWDLPKGKIEKNETPEAAAIREVEEETAVNKLSIIEELNSSFHIYTMNNKLILKKTYWYRMQCKFHGKLIPQTDEDIEIVEWKTAAEAEWAIGVSYRSLNENLGQYFKL